MTENFEVATPADIVPVIDIGQDPSIVGRQLDEAYTEVGFCQIINHGLDAEIEQRAWEAAKEFFALDEEHKLSLKIRDAEAYGYGAFEAEALAASLGETTPPDLKETYSSGPLHKPASAAGNEAGDFLFSPNRWSERIPDLQEVFEAHYTQLAKLVEKIMAAMALGLDLPSTYFDRFFTDHTSGLRALHYPAIADTVAPGQLRAGAHADYGTVTLLRQDDAPGGLEVIGLDNQWHPVASIDGAYVVNVGDALARWTNDRWRSTIHRVAVPPIGPGTADNERYSMAFFHGANWDAEIRCIPTCLGEGEEPRYAPMTAGAHLLEKFNRTQ